jgi:hypothetical protein
MKLPNDLVAFLHAKKQLAYDPATCEAGAIKLLRLDQLKVELFPAFCDGEEFVNNPHNGEQGYYLVEGVSLVGECIDYHPIGLLMWLPLEGCYATWDESHWHIGVFSPSVTWSRIASEPAQHINAQWVGAFEDSAPATSLIPWPKYRYSPQMSGAPFPYSERP